MRNRDRLSQAVTDLRSALGLLTRLPLPQNSLIPRGAEAAWAFPLVGLLIGGIGALAGSVALWLGLSSGVAAATALAAQAMATGAMHEDGLADTADGLWGGWDKPRRLEIMKDSSIGSYGVMALLTVGLARWSALSLLLAAGAWPAILAAGALSRVPLVLMMVGMENARGAGLSKAVGVPSRRTALIAAALGIGAAVLLCGVSALGMVALAALLCLILARVAQAKIGGQTGDILGASQQLAEVAALAVAAGSFT